MARFGLEGETALERRCELLGTFGRTFSQSGTECPYGLSASVWSGDTDRADRVARNFETGSVSIHNVMVTQGNPALPFGGTKERGFGRYRGEDGLRSFCRVKSVMAEDDSGSNPNWHPHDENKDERPESVIENRFSDGATTLPKFALAGLKLNRYTDSLHEEFVDQ